MKKKYVFLLLVLSSFFATLQAQTIRYVKETPTGSGNGSSWANASDDIQAMINASAINDQVWVAGGTYKPNRPADNLTTIDANNQNNAFVLKADVKIYGGFAGAEALLTDRNLSIAANKTTLSGDFGTTDIVTGSGNTLSITENDTNAYHVVISAGDVGTARLDGFTISGGNASGNVTLTVNTKLIFDSYGAGMYNVSSSPVIANCIFNGNMAINNFGGGMYNSSSSPVITNSTFSQNKAVRGGGMSNSYSSSPIITNSTFSGNVATSNGGGGMYNEFSSSPAITNSTFSGNVAPIGGGMHNSSSSSPTITKSTFSGNTAISGGGMSNFSSSSPTITNSTFIGNATTNFGGGMYNSSSSPAIINSTFSGNTASNKGGGIYNAFSSSPTITNSTFNGNTATSSGGGMFNAGTSPKVNNTIITGAIFNSGSSTPAYKNSIIADKSYDNVGTATTTNLTATDLFKDPANGDYSLKIGSAAINAGDNTLYTNAGGNVITDKDLAGNPRVFQTTIDIGAYELQAVSTTLTFQPASGSGSWFLAANWSPAQVPTSIDDAVIPNGKTITIGAGPGAVAKKVTIDIGGSLNIAATGTLTVENNLDNDGTLTIDSDASNNGSVIVGGNYTGNRATYHRYLSGGEWHLISTPLSSLGITIASFIGDFGGNMTQSGVKYSLATYDNSFLADGSSTWKNYTSDGTNPPPAAEFPEGKGYEILMNGNGKVDFTGRINNTPVSYQLTENVTGWNLIGNPFPSSVYGNSNAHATDNFLTQNSASLDPSYVSMYIWNPGSGSYDIVNQGTGSRSIPPGQAFFVKSKTGGATVNFEDNMRTHQSANNFQKGATTSIPTINLSIDNNVGTVRSTDIKYMSGATLGLDPGYDAGQFGAVGTSNFNLYTHLVQDNGVKFALQVVPDTDYDTTVIPIGIDANAGTQITFKATATDLPTDKKVFLEDKLLNTVTEINHTDKTYTVNLSTNLSGTGRFFLHTKANNTLAIDNYVASQYTLVTSPEQHNIRLYGAVAEKGSINIFDSFGRIIYTTTLQKGTEQDINVPIMSTGIYILKFNIDNKPFSKKIVWY